MGSRFDFDHLNAIYVVRNIDMNISTATEEDFIAWFAGADGKRARRLEVQHFYGGGKYSISGDFLYTPIDDEDGRPRWDNKPLCDSDGEPLLFDSHDKAEAAIREMGLWEEYETRWVLDDEGNKTKFVRQYSHHVE